MKKNVFGFEVDNHLKTPENVTLDFGNMWFSCFFPPEHLQSTLDTSWLALSRLKAKLS